MQQCAFLPLTRDAAARLCHDGRGRGASADLAATAVRHRVEEVEAAAAYCWTALLADCDTEGRRELGPRLRRLSDAASRYVGTRWWFAEGSAYRRRVAAAQARLEDAITDGDGQEFARAFEGYDHAMASAVVCAGSTSPRAARPPTSVRRGP